MKFTRLTKKHNDNYKEIRPRISASNLTLVLPTNHEKYMNILEKLKKCDRKEL